MTSGSTCLATGSSPVPDFWELRGMQKLRFAWTFRRQLRRRALSPPAMFNYAGRLAACSGERMLRPPTRLATCSGVTVQT